MVEIGTRAAGLPSVQAIWKQYVVTEHPEACRSQRQNNERISSQSEKISHGNTPGESLHWIPHLGLLVGKAKSPARLNADTMASAPSSTMQPWSHGRLFRLFVMIGQLL